MYESNVSVSSTPPPSNITGIDNFDRPNNATIGTSTSMNDTTYYGPAWTEVENGLTSFAITSNTMTATYGATGAGSHLALKINDTFLFMNKNQSGLALNTINNIVFQP